MPIDVPAITDAVVPATKVVPASTLPNACEVTDTASPPTTRVEPVIAPALPATTPTVPAPSVTPAAARGTPIY